MRCILLVSLITFVAPALGAQPGGTIDPGMTKAQVVENLGAPASERVAGKFTYLFYKNGCEKECGMSDLVVLKDDAVVDAVFRAGVRKYNGTSSSPVGGRHPEPTITGPLRVPGDSANRATGAVVGIEVNTTPAAKPDVSQAETRVHPDSVPAPDSTATPPEE
jgi:hypothetical protein